jgi:hypothetical protein
VFKIEFGQKPERTLHIHRLTMGDIRTFVNETLNKNDVFQRLASEDAGYLDLIEEITTAAEGAFLWVRLATRSLLEGIIDADRIENLQEKLRRLPRKLYCFYDLMLSTIKEDHKMDAARSLLLTLLPIEHLLTMYMYLDDYTRSTHWSMSSMTLEDLRKDLERTDQRLNAQCKGLLESDLERLPTSFKENFHENIFSAKVSPIHRSVRDYLLRPSVYSRLVKDAGCDFSAARAQDLALIASINGMLLIFSEPNIISENTALNRFACGYQIELKIILLLDQMRARANSSALEAQRKEMHHLVFTGWLELSALCSRRILGGVRMFEVLAGRSLPRGDISLDFALYMVADIVVDQYVIRNPDLPNSLIEGVPVLFRAMQTEAQPTGVKPLLNNGADPNRRVGECKAWEYFLITYFHPKFHDPPFGFYQGGKKKCACVESCGCSSAARCRSGCIYSPAFTEKRHAYSRSYW